MVESYFYLWRITKEQKYRDWAWEAAQVAAIVNLSRQKLTRKTFQAIEEHCKSRYGYSGLRGVDQKSPPKDDLQRSFFLAETLK